MFAGRVKAPFWGDGGATTAVLAQPSLRVGVNKHRNTCVSRCCTRPVSIGERSRPGVGSALNEPGAALARLRAAVNTRRRCKRRDRRSGAGRSPGMATKGEVAARFPASATAKLSAGNGGSAVSPKAKKRSRNAVARGAGTESGSSNQVEVQHQVSHRRPRFLPRPPGPADRVRPRRSGPGPARCPAPGPVEHAQLRPPAV